MSRYDVAFLACRMLAVMAIGFAFTGVPAAFGVLFDAARGMIDWGYALVNTSSVVGAALAGAVIWFLAPVIAHRMVPRVDAGLPPLRVSAHTLMAVAFSAIGMWFFANGLLSMLWVFASMTVESSYATTRTASDLTWGSIEVAVGGWLLIGSRGIVWLITRVRRAGVREPTRASGGGG